MAAYGGVDVGRGRPQDRRRHQGAAVGGAGGVDAAGHRRVGDRAAAVRVEQQVPARRRGLVRRVVDHRHRVEVRHVQPGQQLGGGARVGGEQHGAAADLAVLGGGHRGGGDRGDPDAGVHGARRQGAREQLRQDLRAALRQAQPAGQEGVQGQVRAAAGRGEVRVAQQGGQQRTQEAVDRAGGQAPGRQRLPGGQLGTGQQAVDGRGGDPGQRGAQPEGRTSAEPPGGRTAGERRGGARHVTRPGTYALADRGRPGGACQGAHNVKRAPRAPPVRRCARAVVPSVAVQQDPRREGAQHERVESRAQDRMGIRRGQQLSDPVEPEPVDLLRRHAAAHPGGGFQDRGGHSCAGQPVRRREPGHPGSHDDDIRLIRGLKHVPLLEVARQVGQ